MQKIQSHIAQVLAKFEKLLKITILIFNINIFILNCNGI